MESLRYTDGNISGNACLRFFCGCAKVRGESDIGQTEERVFFRLQRFVRPYVNTGSGDFSILQCLGERFDIDAAPRDALTMRTPSFIFAMASLSIIPRVSSVSGVWRVM